MLLHAHDKPKLIRWSDNVRILELLAQNDIMDEQEAQALTRAYTTLRDELHHGATGAARARGAGLFCRRARSGNGQLAEVAGGTVRNKSSVILSRANCESFWSQE